jgi:hypothetical protein
VPEKDLRDMSFGYRAKYIPAAVKQVLAKEDEGASSLLSRK